MPKRKLGPPLVVFVFLAAAVLSVTMLSCDDEEEGDASPTATVTARAAIAATATPQDITDIDLSQQADVQGMLRRVGGEVIPADILYADLTGDGREEAVVPISSGGTAGNIAFLVLGYQDGDLVPLLSKVPESGSVRLAVRDGQLVETQPVYQEGDQAGFPQRIRNTYYKWDGEKLLVEREETTPSPYAPPKQ